MQIRLLFKKKKKLGKTEFHMRMSWAICEVTNIFINPSELNEGILNAPPLCLHRESHEAMRDTTVPLPPASISLLPPASCLPLPSHLSELLLVALMQVCVDILKAARSVFPCSWTD